MVLKNQVEFVCTKEENKVEPILTEENKENKEKKAEPVVILEKKRKKR